MTILSKTRLALKSTPRLERDTAMVELALVYAKCLDELLIAVAAPEAAEDPVHHKRVISEIDIVGRRLESVLDKLGMSPGSRPALRGGQEGAAGDPQSAALDGLRADAAAGTARVDYASAVDPAVTAADA